MNPLSFRFLSWECFMSWQGGWRCCKKRKKVGERGKRSRRIFLMFHFTLSFTSEKKWLTRILNFKDWFRGKITYSIWWKIKCQTFQFCECFRGKFLAHEFLWNDFLNLCKFLFDLNFFLLSLTRLNQDEISKKSHGNGSLLFIFPLISRLNETKEERSSPRAFKKL